MRLLKYNNSIKINDMKHIIKIYDWCIYFVECETTDEILNKLVNIGIDIKVIDSCKCREENLGVLFDTCINTSVLCKGNDTDATEKAISEIKNILTKLYSKELGDSIEHNYDIRRDIMDYFRDIPHLSNAVKIYVESEEKYKVPPYRCIIPREYDSIDDIEHDDFWYYMETLAGQYKP